jgi:hypothetical protein
MRSLEIATGTPKSLAVFATIGTLTRAESLPGPADARCKFAPGHAYVHRVPRQNLWVWYRFGDDHVDVLALRSEPPVPDDDEPEPNP